jgi:dsRNA-specific ribonuclease
MFRNKFKRGKKQQFKAQPTRAKRAQNYKLFIKPKMEANISIGSILNETNLKRKHADDDSAHSSQEAKYLKANDSVDISSAKGALKNAVQQIYEIKEIQPIEYGLVSMDGPAHKPNFNYSLSFKLSDVMHSFYGCGVSKKVAKTIASIKALYFLYRIRNFFSAPGADYIHSVILGEMRALNISQDMESFFNSEVKSKIDEQRITNELNKIKESVLMKESVQMKHEPMSFDSIYTSFESEQPLLVNELALDSKTKEILASKNTLSILSHLLPQKQYEINVIDEEGMSHSKIFKTELKIFKTVMQSSNFLSLFNVRVVNNQIAVGLSRVNSILVTENESEYIFYGLGNSKKVAKSKSAKLALENIFKIKLEADGRIFEFFYLNVELIFCFFY